MIKIIGTCDTFRIFIHKIKPSVFGKLLKSNLDNLEKEGLHIESKRTGAERIYVAKYEEPIDDHDE